MFGDSRGPAANLLATGDELLGFFFEILGFNDFGQQSPTLGLCGIKAFPQNKDFFGFGQTDELYEFIALAGIGRRAVEHLGEGEEGGIGRNPKVTGQDQLATGSETGTVNGSNREGVEVLQNI